MKNLLKAVLSIFVLAFIILPINVSASETQNDIIYNDENGIPDKEFYKHILIELNKKDGEETLTKTELSEIKELTIAGYVGKNAVSSLKGIEYFENLEKLFISRSIENLEGIENLSKLTNVSIHIDFSKEEGHDWSYIGKIKNLQDLRLEGCNLTNKDLKEIIGNAAQIEYLDLQGNKLTSLEGLEGLTNLSYLELFNNRLTSIKGIEQFTNLTVLGISCNKIKGIKGVEKLNNLTCLYAQSNKIKTLPNMRNMTKLLRASFYNNKLSTKELKSKLPKNLKSNKAWLYNNTIFQNIKQKLSIDNFSSINSYTKKISGRTQSKVTVALINDKKRYITTTTAKKNGKFVFENLNLRKYKGKKITIKSFIKYLSDGETEFDEDEYVIKKKTFVLK